MRRITAPAVANQALTTASAIFAWATARKSWPPIPAPDRAQRDQEPRARLSEARCRNSGPRSRRRLVGRGAQDDSADRPASRRVSPTCGASTSSTAGGRCRASPCLARLAGTKNGATHRVWLPAPVRAIIDELDERHRLPVRRPARRPSQDRRGDARDLQALGSSGPRRTICAARTEHNHRVGFGRDAMNRFRTTRRAASASFTTGTATPRRTRESWRRWRRGSSRWPRAGRRATSSRY